MSSIEEVNGRVNFLKERLKIAQEQWEKANKKWVSAKSEDCAAVEIANLKVKGSMTKMAFFNGQRKVLKELIALEKR
jgi:hypothetical protein